MRQQHSQRSPWGWAALLAAILVTIAFVVVVGCQPRGQQRAGGGSGPPSSSGGQATLNPINGLPATPQAIARRPLAVLIENSPAARPQSGLEQADVVYEAITEGGITRFLAIYLQGEAEKIGPVRSARPHFINLSREYDAALVHCGESYEALQILATTPDIYNLNQMHYPKPFWRDHARQAPHNLYASTEKLREFMVKKGWESSVMRVTHFTGNGPLTRGDDAPEVNIDFGGATNYRLRMVYDAKAGGYLRYMDGKLHKDKETGEALLAKNVVIQFVHAAPFAKSKKGTFDVSVITNGTGYFISNGKRVHLLWQKDAAVSPTTFATEDGNPLPFQAGQTWVELVPVDGKVRFIRQQQ